MWTFETRHQQICVKTADVYQQSGDVHLYGDLNCCLVNHLMLRFSETVLIFSLTDDDNAPELIQTSKNFIRQLPCEPMLAMHMRFSC